VAAFKLLSTSGEQTVEIVPGRTFVVGRAVTSDIPVYDPTVSRRHAELALRDEGVRVVDLGSSNGTFVNGSRITDAVVGDGDVLTFGKIAFNLVAVTPQPARTPEPRDSGAFSIPVPEATIVKQVAIQEVPDLDERLASRRSGGMAEIGESGQVLKYRLLVQIGQKLNELRDVDQLLKQIVNDTFKVMNADRVSVLMLEGAPEELVSRTSYNRLDDSEVVVFSHSIARHAVREQVAVLTDNAAADERFNGKSILMQNVRSAMCTPLWGRREGRVLGTLYVDSLTSTNSFNDEDLDFLMSFSGTAAAAIENAQLIEKDRREAVKLANFQRYFAPDLARQIAGEAEAVQLGGSKRPVVVFFSDIRGFTPMSEAMSPDEIASLLTEYFTEMVEIVFEHGGTLDKFMGDAIMALWGAPISYEDDADRAMRAAIEQQEVLARLNTKWVAEGRQPMSIGIGINFGEVFAGNIGSDRRLEYTVIGDAVNTASRLCSKAGPGEILLSEPFYRALTTPPPVEALDPLELRGKSRAVPVYRVKR
jgi:adenylate cyclase